MSAYLGPIPFCSGSVGCREEALAAFREPQETEEEDGGVHWEAVSNLNRNTGLLASPAGHTGLSPAFHAKRDRQLSQGNRTLPDASTDSPVWTLLRV